MNNIYQKNFEQNENNAETIYFSFISNTRENVVIDTIINHKTHNKKIN